MPSFKDPSFQDRIARAAEARQKALDQLKAKPAADPAALAARQAERAAREAAQAEKRAADKEAKAEAKARPEPKRRKPRRARARKSASRRATRAMPRARPEIRAQAFPVTGVRGRQVRIVGARHLSPTISTNGQNKVLTMSRLVSAPASCHRSSGP